MSVGAPCPRRLRLSIWSWIVGAQELAFQQFESPVKEEFLPHLSRQRRNIDPGLQHYAAVHERRTLGRQTQHVADMPVRHGDVQRNGAALFAFVPDDRSAVLKRVEPSVAWTGFKTVFPLVPSTSTSKVRRQRHRVIAHLQRKSGTRASPRA